MSDHMQKVLKTNWSTSWDEIGVENEFEDHLTLSIPTLEGYFFYLYSFCPIIIVSFLECVEKISSCMEMQPCEQSEQVAEEKKSHILYLAGIYRGGHDVLVRAQMALEGTSAASSAATISMGLKIRSSNQSVVQAIAAYVYKQSFF